MTDIQNKLDSYKEENQKLKNLNEMITQKTGDVSVNKGKVFENIIDFILQSKIKDEYEIINNSKTRKMDVRLRHKTKNVTIGIECKDKKCVSKNDIDKFKRDKLENKFKKSIFISTNKIPKILSIEDTCTIIDDELYIYSNDTIFIGGVVCCFLSTINDDNDECIIKLDHIMNLYNHWKNAKHTLNELDKVFIDIISTFNKDALKGHLYFRPISSLKK